MSITVKISAIQGELGIFDTNTVESGSEEKTFSLDISDLSVGRFQLKFEGKGNGKIKNIACAVVETADNFPFTLSSYTVNSETYKEIASPYCQKLSSDCKTLIIKLTMEAI